MNYFIYTSHHFTPHGRYEPNKLTSLPMCGFIAQLVEHRTSIAEVTGSNPIEALNFFRLLLSNCLNWKINCEDHSLLGSTTAVQYMNYFIYTSHQRKSITKVQKQYVTELKWIRTEIISSPVTRQLMNQNDFSFSRISVLITVVCPLTDVSFNAYLVACRLAHSLHLPSSFNEIEIKQSPISFRAAATASVHHKFLLKPRARTTQSLIALSHTHILLCFLGKITVLLPLFRFGFQRIINWTVLFQQYSVPCLEQT